MADHDFDYPKGATGEVVAPALPELGAQKAWVGLIVATVFSGLTAGLAFASDGSMLFIVLTLVSAMLTPLATALGVYSVSNRAR
jgi:hypothetical protein